MCVGYRTIPLCISKRLLKFAPHFTFESAPLDEDKIAHSRDDDDPADFPTAHNHPSLVVPAVYEHLAHVRIREPSQRSRGDG